MLETFIGMFLFMGLIIGAFWLVWVMKGLFNKLIDYLLWRWFHV